MVSGGYLFSRPRLPQCGKVVQRRRRSSNSLPYWISCSLHRPPDALTVDPITSPCLFDLARKIHTHQRPKKNTMRLHGVLLWYLGGYLFSRPRLPQCGKVVQRRRRSSNSLPYWISCSLHRPPDALTVDPITSPCLFDLARKIHTHQRPKKNTMRCMVFFFGIRRLPIFPGRHQPSIFGV